MNDLRELPSVDRLLRHDQAIAFMQRYGRALVLSTIQQVMAEIRHAAGTGLKVDIREEVILSSVERLLEERMSPSLVKVINASGVVLHTNLGRAPLSISAQQAISATAGGYSNLEFDLPKGTRGSRSVHSRDILCLITGAEDALVVNNNAGALLLCLSALASRRGVVISRSQLVEIGGGFRIPDVMKQSRARLVEVGTTNRVNLKDYEDAIQQGAALLMRAHSSNFKLVGFTVQPDLDELVALAHRYNLPFLDDLGSGALLDTARFGLAHEPMVQESLGAGVDLVCFSGDKLLGGPQAGIIVGRRDLIDKIKRHPLARAIRADKLCLAALAATLRHYLVGDAETQIPVWQMISASLETLRQRAEYWKNSLGYGEVITGSSTVGGGSLPEETLPTFVLSLSLPKVERAAKQLRLATPAIVGRVQNDHLLLDPRTVLLQEDDLFITTLKKTLQE